MVDKWFAVQARSPAEDALGRVLGLTAHPAFDRRESQPFARAGAAASPPATRCASTPPEGYRFLADQILGRRRHQPPDRLAPDRALRRWARYTPALAESMKAQLARIADHPGVSKNSYELAAKALQPG